MLPPPPPCVQVGEGKGCEGLWNSVEREVQKAFRYNLAVWKGGGWIKDPSGQYQSEERCSRVPLLRRVCQRLGLRVASKTYDFSLPTPVSLVSPSGGGGGGWMCVEDLVDIRPVSHHCLGSHPSPDAHALVEAALAHLHRYDYAGAFDLAHQAVLIYQEVCTGGVHKELATAIHLTGLALLHSGDMEACLNQMVKALSLHQQLSGLDSQLAITAHSTLATMLRSAGSPQGAVRHLRALVHLLCCTCGVRHPDVASAHLALGEVYQEVGALDTALLCYREGLVRGCRIPHAAAQLYHGIAECMSTAGHLKEALAAGKQAYGILKSTYGEVDSRTIDALLHLKRLTQRSVDLASAQQQLQQEQKARHAGKVGAVQGSAGNETKRNRRKKGKK